MEVTSQGRGGGGEVASQGRGGGEGSEGNQ